MERALWWVVEYGLSGGVCCCFKMSGRSGTSTVHEPLE